MGEGVAHAKRRAEGIAPHPKVGNVAKKFQCASVMRSALV